MTSTVWYGFLLLGWGHTLLVTIRSIERWRDRADRAYIVSSWALALTATLMTPSVYVMVDELIGIPNVSRMLGFSTALFGAWAFQPFMWRLLHLPVREHGTLGSPWLMAGALVVSWVLFILAPVDRSEPIGFSTVYGKVPFVAEQMMVTAGYIAVMLSQVFVASWRAWREATDDEVDSLMRLRIGSMAFGWGFGVMTALHVGLHPLVGRLGLEYPGLSGSIVSVSLFGIFLVLILSGMFFDLWERMTDTIALRHLDRLARWLDEATEVTYRPLSPGLGSKAQLRQRVTAIFDAEGKLRPYCDESIAGEASEMCAAAGIEGDRKSAILDAASLVVAVEAKASEKKASEPKRSLREARRHKRVPYLVQVAKARDGSEIVREALSRWQGRQAGHPTSPIRYRPTCGATAADREMVDSGGGDNMFRKADENSSRRAVWDQSEG
ncbi:MAG: hypothetical protein M3P51_05690 [Chloroflexota bacterium]|nr:hypothetical protein [Chloroflexota bacterium]